MRARSLSFVVVGLFLVAACPATKKKTQQARDGASAASTLPDLGATPAWKPRPAVARIVAIGDLHGDLAATRAVLRLAGAIDAEDRWIGGELVVVQIGDRLDRGDEDRQVLELFDELVTEASAAGGQVLPLLGNHETMNVAGHMGYVTPGGYRAFDGLAGIDVEQPGLQRYPAHERARRAAFLPGGPYAQRLARHDVVAQIGETVFVHGGVLPEHVTYGLARINEETRRWIAGKSPEPGHISAGPTWTNHYSGTPVSSAACAALAQVLSALGAKRMVVAHVVQREGITAACDDRIWRVDVGLARHYGGPIEILELTEGAAPKTLTGQR